jgi:hypothetical protein
MAKKSAKQLDADIAASLAKSPTKKLRGMKILGTKTTKLGPMTRVECDRCAGTGNWDPNGYRVCYKCGGRGELLLDTAESAYNRKRAHIDEVKGIIADETKRLATARWGKSIIERQIAERKAQLIQLEAELAAMKALG